MFNVLSLSLSYKNTKNPDCKKALLIFLLMHLPLWKFVSLLGIFFNIYIYIYINENDFSYSFSCWIEWILNFLSKDCQSHVYFNMKPDHNQSLFNYVLRLPWCRRQKKKRKKRKKKKKLYITSICFILHDY